MSVRNTIYLSLCWFLCIQCIHDADGMCLCCCKGNGNGQSCMPCMQAPTPTSYPGRCQSYTKCTPFADNCVCENGTCDANCLSYRCKEVCMGDTGSEENNIIDGSSDTSSSAAVVAVVVSCCVVIVIIAILITVCYWIHKKHHGNRSNSKSSTVRYAAKNGKVDIEGETSVATQPLPPIPVENHYTPSKSQQNTYEQIDPEYLGLQQDKNAAAYTTLQPNNDSIPNGNLSTTPDMSETTNLKTSKDNSETLLYSNGSKDKRITAYYTLQRDENSDITETSHTTDANDEGEADDYAKLRQNDIEEESYSKLNHNARKSVLDDVTDDYNKLIPTPVFDEESEDYSHLKRTSLNVDESVTDPGYGKLNLYIEPAESTAKSNDGYEETLPSILADMKHEHVTSGGSNNRVEKTNLNNGYEEAIVKNSDQLEGNKSHVEKANLNNGYEEAIVKNSDQLEGKSYAGRANDKNGYEEAIVNKSKDN